MEYFKFYPPIFGFSPIRKKRVFSRTSLFFFLFSFFSSLCFAAIDFNDSTYPELVSTTRALGMGNAYINRANDSGSVFYNPSGLGSVRGIRFHLVNGQLEGAYASDLTRSDMGFNEEEARQDFYTKRTNRRGELAGSRGSFMPNITLRYLSMGYMASSHVRTIMDKAGTTLEYAKRYDQGPYAALNVSVWGGVFKAGLAAVYVDRTEVFREDSASSAITLQKPHVNRGSALILIPGAKLTLPVAFLPSFGFSMYNSANQQFSKNDEYAKEPSSVLQNIGAAFSITPALGNRSWLHLEYNFRDIGNRDKTRTTRARHMGGLEFDFQHMFFLRAGFSDGYATGGWGFRVRGFEFDMATYSIFTKTNENPDGIEDRRFVGSLSLGF